CRIVHQGVAYSRAGVDSFTLRGSELSGWKQLIAECADDPMPQRIVYFWALDEAARDNSALGTDSLLYLAQALELTRPSSKLRIDLITRGAQPAGRNAVVTAPAQAPDIGLLRVILNEYPNLSCRGIDLPPEVSDSDAEL